LNSTFEVLRDAEVQLSYLYSGKTSYGIYFATCKHDEIQSHPRMQSSN
jgi:hypothetical protein